MAEEALPALLAAADSLDGEEGDRTTSVLSINSWTSTVPPSMPPPSQNNLALFGPHLMMNCQELFIGAQETRSEICARLAVQHLWAHSIPLLEYLSGSHRILSPK